MIIRRIQKHEKEKFKNPLKDVCHEFVERFKTVAHGMITIRQNGCGILYYSKCNQRISTHKL